MQTSILPMLNTDRKFTIFYQPRVFILMIRESQCYQQIATPVHSFIQINKLANTVKKVLIILHNNFMYFCSFINYTFAFILTVLVFWRFALWVVSLTPYFLRRYRTNVAAEAQYLLAFTRRFFAPLNLAFGIFNAANSLNIERLYRIMEQALYCNYLKRQIISIITKESMS